jgi:hypothetical protein
MGRIGGRGGRGQENQDNHFKKCYPKKYIFKGVNVNKALVIYA